MNAHGTSRGIDVPAETKEAGWDSAVVIKRTRQPVKLSP